jgi:hypothetical protein
MYNDESPCSGWAEILLLLERLEPQPALISSDPEQRAVMMGLAHEICSEMGLVGALDCCWRIRPWTPR